MIEAGAPIFVLAPHPRSGTNMLGHLLSAHPTIDPSPVPEDFLSARAHLLSDYAEHVVGYWERFFEHGLLDRTRYTPDQLLAEFGRSLLNFVGPLEPDRHLLLKSPTTVGLPDLQRLFPTGRMLILLRDPRSIAESWIRANFGSRSSLEEVGYRWASSMRALEGWLDPQKPVLDRTRIHFVRFEELAHNSAGEYARLLEAVGLPLDPDAIAYAADPPVIGSSFRPDTYSHPKRGQTPDFKPQPRPEDFDPTVRWAHWSPQTHSRFNRTCGTIMKRWGFAPVRAHDVYPDGHNRP